MKFLELHNAVEPFGDDPVRIAADHVSSYSTDHTLASGDCTRIITSESTVYQVKETVDEIDAMLK